MKLISLTQGKSAKINDHWYDYLMQWKWSAYKDSRSNKWYATRIEGTRPNRKQILMHRVVSGCKHGEMVDHRDGDGLNNQDENLRTCTNSQNQANRQKPSNNTSGWKGVQKTRNRKFIARLVKNKVTVFCKTFKSGIDAAKAYDTAAIEHFGDFANLNFSKESNLMFNPKPKPPKKEAKPPKRILVKALADRRKFSRTERSQLESELVTLCSKYVRLRDGNQCVTCGSQQELTCSHFIKRAKQIVSYDVEVNLNCQCLTCNGIHNRDESAYMAYLIKKHGLAKVEVLKALNGISYFRWSVIELRDMVEDMKKKLESLYGRS